MPPAADRDLERARVLARVAWADVEGSEEWDSLGLDEVAARRFRQRAWATVEAYFSCETPSDVVPVARELEVEVTLDGVPFRGFIDLVEQAPGSAVGAGGQQSIVITDYKTGKPPEKDKPWSEEQTTERLWQPLWYAAALSEMGEHLPVRARLLYFTALDARRGGGFDTRTGELSVDLDDEALSAARVELRRRWDDIAAAREAGHADATPGPLCGWCPYVDVCDEGRAEVERRWEERNDYTGERRLRHDAPAVTMLGLRDTEVLIA